MNAGKTRYVRIADDAIFIQMIRTGRITFELQYMVIIHMNCYELRTS